MKILALGILTLFVFSSLVYAQEADPGITPDSPLWGLDRALEQLRLALTLGDTDKAKVALEQASERLAEVKVMIEENKIEHAEKAKEEHNKKILEVKQKVKEIDADDEDAIDETVEIEAEIEEQDEDVDELENELEIKIKGQITPEQQAALEALINSFKNSNNDVRIEIKIKRDEIKVKIKERTGKDDDEIEDEFERIENETGLTEFKKERAEEQIRDAEEELNDAKQELQEQLGSNITWPSAINSLLREAEKHLRDAKDLFEQGDYGAAYGLANSAEQLAENVEKKAEELGEEREEDKDKKYIGLGDECSRIKFVCAEGSTYFKDDKGCGCKEVDKGKNACQEISNTNFRSIKQYEAGLTPLGETSQGYWRIRFENGQFSWSHSDVVEKGSYVCDGDKILGTSTGGKKLTGEYDQDGDILIWDGREYIEEI